MNNNIILQAICYHETNAAFTNYLATTSQDTYHKMFLEVPYFILYFIYICIPDVQNCLRNEFAALHMSVVCCGKFRLIFGRVLAPGEYHGVLFVHSAHDHYPLF